MSAEDLERYETEIELQLYKEYRDVLPMFTYVVETERRFYLTNSVKLSARTENGQTYFELELSDAWVWDMYRPARFVANVRVVTFKDVNIEELAKDDLTVADHRRSLGVAGEDAVAAWYSDAGYALLDRNWRCREGELDLVVARGRRGGVLRGQDPTRLGVRRAVRSGDVHEAAPPPHPRAPLAVGASRAPRARAALRRRLGAGGAGHRPRDRRPRSGVLTLRVAPLTLGAAPAPGVPVAPLLGHALRHHDLVAETAGDLVVAARAAVDLHRLVRLHVRDLELVGGAVRHPNTAQSTSAATTASAIATITRSVPRFACARNGLRPMPSP